MRKRQCEGQCLCWAYLVMSRGGQADTLCSAAVKEASNVSVPPKPKTVTGVKKTANVVNTAMMEVMLSVVSTQVHRRMLAHSLADSLPHSLPHSLTDLLTDSLADSLAG